MLDWLFRSQFDPTTNVAIWSIGGVLGTTLVLFLYTLGLRLTTIAGTRRRARIVTRWRDVFAASVLSEEELAWHAGASGAHWCEPGD
jgi:hypothetical protein